MSGILWIIFVGFVAGIIARLLSPGPKIQRGLFSQRFWGSRARFSRLSSVRRSVITGRTRVRASLPPRLGRWRFFSSGTGSWPAA